jgi:3-methyladenine DNA glycosylase/8-oxoguanine DNA glycosylase
VSAPLVVEVPPHHDLRQTLGPFRPPGDRSTRFMVDGTVWRATRTPDGPATGRYRPVGRGRVAVDAWGAGAGWLLAHAAELIGARDDVTGFAELAARHPVVAALHHDHPGYRLPRSLAVYEALLPVVVAQKVTSAEAREAWKAIQYRYGTPAPGPMRLRVPPAPEVLADLGYARFHPLGLERKRAETLMAVARAADRLDAARPDVLDVVRSIPGVGPWTAAHVAHAALGDADAVAVGDYHLPDHVCFALAGEQRGTDERMLELLAPFAPHRGRVVRLLHRAKAPQRKGARLAPMDHRRR